MLELQSAGPFIAHQLRGWLDKPPRKVNPPPLRRDFLTLADVRTLLAANPGWAKRLRGHLQMHTVWRIINFLPLSELRRWLAARSQ